MKSIYFHRPVTHSTCPICDNVISRVSESRTYLNKQPRCVNRIECARRLEPEINVDDFIYGRLG